MKTYGTSRSNASGVGNTGFVSDGVFIGRSAIRRRLPICQTKPITGSSPRPRRGKITDRATREVLRPQDLGDPLLLVSGKLAVGDLLRRANCIRIDFGIWRSDSNGMSSSASNTRFRIAAKSGCVRPASRGLWTSSVSSRSTSSVRRITRGGFLISSPPNSERCRSFIRRLVCRTCWRRFKTFWRAIASANVRRPGCRRYG